MSESTRLCTGKRTETPPPPAQGLGKVLVIDDTAIDLILYRRVMTRSKLFRNILTFDYAEDALAHMSDHPDEPIDAILLDINMPRMDGYEFLDAAAARPERFCGASVVVMLTTSPPPEKRTRLESFDVFGGYVDKPLTDANLDEVVHLIRDRRPFSRPT